jgi:hypothetical protein
VTTLVPVLLLSFAFSACAGSMTARNPDHVPPIFAGLNAATTCLPGPTDEGTSSRYRLRWKPARDDRTPANQIVYLVYQARAPHGERFSHPTYTSAPGAKALTTPPLPGEKSHYFVVRAMDAAGQRESNRVERQGENLCQ